MTDFKAQINRADFQMLSLGIVIWGPATQDMDGLGSLNVKELATERGTVFERISEMTAGNKLYMNEDVAKALMLGLLEYFGEYKGDVRVLRQDYQAERKRVDRFIDYLVRDNGTSDR